MNASVPGPLLSVDKPSAKIKSINELNYDCFLHILKYIPVLKKLEIEKVCHKWKKAVELSWCDVKNLDFNDLMITLEKREEISKMIMMRCCKYLTHLTVIENEDPSLRKFLKTNCQNIIGFSMERLVYLKVSMHADGASNLFSKILKKLPNHMQEIHLIATHKPIYQFAPVLNRFKALSCLTIQGFYLTHSTVETIMENQNTLVKLDLSGCVFPPGAFGLISNIKNLEHLNLWKVTNFDVNEIVSIAHNCSKLKHIEILIHNEKVQYRILYELRYLNLEHLKFHGIDVRSNNGKNQISDIIPNNWKELKYLDVGAGLNFSQSDIKEIAKYKNLEYFNLSGKFFIEPQSFIDIVNNCLYLKELKMRFRWIPETALEKLANLKKLERLNIAGSNNLTGRVLCKIASNCKNLIELDISTCHHVTEDSLLQVGKLQQLKKLRMNHITNIPNAMFDHLYKLERLACCNCPSVTDEGIIKVLDNCQKLRYLDVCDTGITVRSLVHASKRQFVFVPLSIQANSSVKKNYRQYAPTSSPYLRI